MFGLLGRSRRKAKPWPPRHARLWLEALEERHCLSAAAPSLTLSTQVNPGHTVVLSGYVTDSQPMGIPVSFSGAVTGRTTTNTMGYYSFSTMNASLGSVSAVAVDSSGLSSNTAAGTIAVTAPSLAMSISYDTLGKIRLSGTVTGADPGGLSVSLSGVLTGSASTASNGTFGFVGRAIGTGSIQATVTDAWGNFSSAQVSFNPDPPAITAFTGTEGMGNVWTFKGTVSAPERAGMMVQLGGLPSLQNAVATVQADGTWSVTVQLKTGESGMASAITTDWWGQKSEAAMFNV